MIAAFVTAIDFTGGGTVSGSLSITAPPSVTNTAGTTSTVVTGTITATASGGTPPYHYAWRSDESDGITALAPVAASTSFKRSGMFSGDTYQGIFYCAVVDALGAIANSDAVTVTIGRT
jgi:hypothetical protein